MSNPAVSDDARIRSIALRARPLWLRQRSELRDLFGPLVEGGKIDLAAESSERTRALHWCSIAAGGDEKAFCRRLNGVLFRAGGSDAPGNESEDSEVKLVEVLLRKLRRVAESDSFRGAEEAEAVTASLPFAPLLTPLVDLAEQELAARIDMSILSGEALRGLLAALAGRLGEVCTNAFFHQFQASQPVGQQLTNLLMADSRPRSTAAYNAYVASALQSGYLDLFDQFPALARVIAIIVDQWSAASVEFLRRLTLDRKTLHGVFGAAGEIIKVTSALSDPHFGGRSVSIVSFANGAVVVYKPRGLEMEHAYSQLVTWMTANSAPVSLTAPRVVLRDGYGWCEFIRRADCSDPHLLYRRVGALLCLLHVLGASDFHSENLIAAGDELVPIDCEALVGPEIAPYDDGDGSIDDAGLWQSFRQSVLRVGMLPNWQILGSTNATAVDLSALGRMSNRPAALRMPIWRDINTDAMRPDVEASPIVPTDAIPTISGARVPAENFVDEISSGFRETYLFVAANARQMLEIDGPLMEFHGLRSRFVFRPTHVYQQVLRNARSIRALSDGIDRSIELDAISRVAGFERDGAAAWPLVECERDSLENLDVPCFAVQTDQRTIQCNGVHIAENYFALSGFEAMRGRLLRMSSDECARQLSLIRGSFAASAARITFAREQPEIRPALSNGQPVCEPLPTAVQLQSIASLIASRIEAEALFDPDGSCNWIGLRYFRHAERFQLLPLSDDLYDGRAGVAIFLLVCDGVEHNDARRAVALASLESLRRKLRRLKNGDSTAAAVLRRVGIGVGFGLGSMIYALRTASYWTESDELLDEACHASKLMTRELIEADDKFDVLSGAAGGILSQLSIYESTQDPGALERARWCGNHLLVRQIPASSGGAGWKSAGGLSPAGFAHGAAGIAYALLRLFEVSGEDRFLRAARLGFEYEDSLFSPSHGNWRDVRVPTESLAYSNRWCHGASGIGLARLAARGILQSSEWDYDIEQAVKCVLSADTANFPDPPCCGEVGAAEMLLESGRQLGKQQLTDEAHRKCGIIIQRFEQQGTFKLFAGHHESEVFSPSFFQGLSGIGYGLLRAAAPERVPSILLFSNGGGTLGSHSVHRASAVT